MRVFVLMTLVVRILLSFLCAPETERVYARYAVSAGEGEDTTVFMDAEGTLWENERSVERGVCCFLIISDGGTSAVGDDRIERVLPLERGYCFVGDPVLMDSADVTTEVLTGRNGAMIIERAFGFVCGDDGDGFLLNGDPVYNYISYREMGFQKASLVETYLIYDPCGSDVDEITERFDFVLI